MPNADETLTEEVGAADEEVTVALNADHDDCRRIQQQSDASAALFHERAISEVIVH